MQNILTHEIGVRFTEGILTKSESWEWFVDYLIQNFDLVDISSWDEFIAGPWIDLYKRFVQINRVSKLDNIANVYLADVDCVSQYYLGKLEEEICYDRCVTQIGRLLFTIAKLTLVLNLENGNEEIYDYRLLIMYNAWQLYNCDLCVLYEARIVDLLDQLQIDDIHKRKLILEANIRNDVVKSREDFLNAVKEIVNSISTFDYHFIHSKSEIWEEQMIIEMLSTSIDENGIHPLFAYRNNYYPPLSEWTDELFSHLEKFFDSTVVSLILATLRYYLYNRFPSSQVIKHYIILLSNSLGKFDFPSILRGSSFWVCTRIISDSSFDKTIKSEVSYDFLARKISQIDDPYTTFILKNNGYPISNTQRNNLRDYWKNVAESISMDWPPEKFVDYINSSDIRKEITTELFSVTQQLFWKLVHDEMDGKVPLLFYDYMKFLISLKSCGMNLNQVELENEILFVQDQWNKHYYEKQKSTLHSASFEQAISKDVIVEFNAGILSNPLSFAHSCIAFNTLDSIMESESENVFSNLVCPFELNPTFPRKAEIDLDNHDIDEYLKKVIEIIIDNKGYRFLNVFDSRVYLRSIHRRWKSNLYIYTSFVSVQSEIYKKLSVYFPNSLISLDSHEVKLAHVTQLFPLIEMKIRELGTILGFVPFKEDLRRFMSFKDPSSILRELLTKVFQESQSFEAVEDLFFIYTFLYNSNSLNIRNEIVHGRSYLEENELGLAFTVSLLSLYMLCKRIEYINNCFPSDE